MARFQAQTNAVLETELEAVRQRLGLRPHQKADLLREITELAAWVLQQADQGRRVLARGEDDERELHHPVLERLRHRATQQRVERIELDEEEVRRLAELLERPFEPSDGLRRVLRNLGDPARRPPRLRWPEPGA